MLATGVGAGYAITLEEKLGLGDDKQFNQFINKILISNSILLGATNVMAVITFLKNKSFEL